MTTKHVLHLMLLAWLLLLGGCGEKPAASPDAPKPPAQNETGLNKTRKTTTNSDLILSQSGRTYLHVPSRSGFRIPHEWKLSPPQTKLRVSSLRMQRGDDTVVTVTWSPIETQLVQVVSAELESFVKRYGESNVGLLEQVTAGNNSGWKVDLTAAADGDLSRHGRVFWFGIDAADEVRWKIKLRATYPRDADTAGIDQLLSQFQWSQRAYGPRPE